jgi:hypothetical protein
MWPWPNCKCGKISMMRTPKRPIEYFCFDCGDREDAKRALGRSVYGPTHAANVAKRRAVKATNAPKGLTHRHRKGLPCVRCENLRFH